MFWSFRRLGQGVFVFFLLSLPPTAAGAEYTLRPGDVLEVNLVGFPDFRQRLPVEIDGTIALPLAGQINLGGMSLSQGRSEIVGALSKKVYQPAVGREPQHLILPNEIFVLVAEYRPVYVSGYVARSGAYPFRPGVTVRQVIALAGGYGVAQNPRVDPNTQLTDLRAEYESLSAEYALDQARISRIRGELELARENPSSGNGPNTASLLWKELKQTEIEYMDARVADRQQDRVALQTAVAKADSQLEALGEKKKKDQESLEADNEELDTVRQLFRRGITANARLSEARRATVLSSDQLLQTIVQITNAERQRGEYLRQINKIEDQAKVENWRDLQQANVHLAQVKARMRSTNEKLLSLGMSGKATDARTDPAYTLTVIRESVTAAQQIAADEDFQLMPGDVVQIGLLDGSETEKPLTPKAASRTE
jgi:polysaccharide export outer membrane protein